MATKQAIKAVRTSTNEVRSFETKAEALRFCLRRGDDNQLWKIEE